MIREGIEQGVKPLSGKRILVTRPEGQSVETARLLESMGAIPIEMPLIAIFPPPDPGLVHDIVGKLNHYDLIVFTSRNAVLRFLGEIEAQGLSASVFTGTRIAAIGPGTASALESRGVCVDIIPPAFIGEYLVNAILEDPLIQSLIPKIGFRVLILRAATARDVLPDGLRQAGCQVDIVPVYETRQVSEERREELIAMLESKSIDCILLASSSAAKSLVNLIGPCAVELLQHVHIASIGPITTRTAESLGLNVHLTATQNTMEGLISALITYYYQKMIQQQITESSNT